jgi:CelD/BcsL family acetyltransferase involved in cellulose biosynthesis
MMLVAQRLNPAGWIDADEIAAGLQQAGEALEQLSRILSKRRRKSRRSGPRDPQAVGERALPHQSVSDQSAPESIDAAPGQLRSRRRSGDAPEDPAEGP